MTETQFYTACTFLLVGCLVAVVLAVLIFPPDKPLPPTDTLIRDCELAGVHVVDNDTVIVCRVMKRNPTSEVETKPEEYL